MSEPLAISKLRRDHAVDSFDCGTPALNRFLADHAWPSQRAGASQTYVATDNETIIGYYSLAVGSVAFDEASERLRMGLARHPVPIMLLARLAVSLDHQRQGYAAGLLKDAIIRTVAAADIAGIRAMIVHAKDDNARAFYTHFGFAPSATDPMHLYLLIKEMRAAGG